MESQQIVYHGREDLRVESQDRPVIGDGDVLVEIEACAICGTDIKTYVNGNPRITPPQTMGHEFCGTIVEVANGVKDYQVGQRVTMATTIGCGECPTCRRGQTNLCPSLQAIGFHYPGAMARWLRVPAKAVQRKHLAPVGNLNADLAALSEPLSCAVNNLGHVPMEEVTRAVVIGLGPLGFLHTILLRRLGVMQVVGVEADEIRRTLARDFPLDGVLTPEALQEQYKEITDGEGFDFVVVTAPSQAAQAGAMQYARKAGYVSLFASLPVGSEMLNVNSRTIHYGELHVFGSSDSTPAHVAQAVGHLQAAPEEFKRIITGRYPMGEITKAMQRIQSREEIKVVLYPNDSKDESR